MNDKICMYCKNTLSINYEYYVVGVQRVKYKKRQQIGYACDDCVERKGCKTLYRLWLGESRP